MKIFKSGPEGRSRAFNLFFLFSCFYCVNHSLRQAIYLTGATFAAIIINKNLKD